MGIVRMQVGAGDAVMSRLWEFVQYDDGRVDEQIDKYTGTQVKREEKSGIGIWASRSWRFFSSLLFLLFLVQISAISLTWGYANVLHAMREGGGAARNLEEALKVAKL